MKAPALLLNTACDIPRDPMVASISSTPGYRIANPEPRNASSSYRRAMSL